MNEAFTFPDDGELRPGVVVMLRHGKHWLAGLRRPNRCDCARSLEEHVRTSSWQLLQEGMKYRDADVIETARRCLEEEAGIARHLTRLVQVLPIHTRYELVHGRNGTKGQRHVWVVFDAVGDIPLDMRLATSPEMVKLAWMKPDKILRKCKPVRRQFYELGFVQVASYA